MVRPYRAIVPCPDRAIVLRPYCAIVLRPDRATRDGAG